ncbi:hypothetical protein ACFVFS_39320 [Kitasatospora sp. NPDC057692]|uniref:hypothetical protein n=1 Tax=Kitasatospora sp. NPDC057692 TaxID=3346215 RepID=UPI00367EEE85
MTPDEPAARRPTASNITDPELDELYARLDTAADLLAAGHADFHDRVQLARRLCAGELTAAQARAEDGGE